MNPLIVTPEEILESEERIGPVDTPMWQGLEALGLGIKGDNTRVQAARIAAHLHNHRLGRHDQKPRPTCPECPDQ